MVWAGAAAHADGYKVQELVKGSPLRGVQGLTFGPDGAFYAASLFAQTIYRVDIETGALEIVVAPPLGSADDLAMAYDGTMAWTDIAQSTVRAMRPDGRIEDLAHGLPGVNGINFGPDGRLFVTVLSTPSKLIEVDVTGAEPPQVVMEVPGKLNGFEIDKNYQLFGPLSARNSVVRIDLPTKTVNVIADGFVKPIAVNLDSAGNIVMVDYTTGEVHQIDARSGDHTMLVQLEPPIDNHAIASNGLIYVSRPAFGRIDEIDPLTGAVRAVVDGWFSGPGGITVAQQDGKEILIVADLFGHRTVDPETGAVTMATHHLFLSNATFVAATDDRVYAGNVWQGSVH